MKKAINNIILYLSAIIIVGFISAQGSGFLSQKLMVENNVQERVQNALSKIVDNNKYVINVDVDLEISDEVEEQITVMSEDKTNNERPTQNIIGKEKTPIKNKTEEIQEIIEQEDNQISSSYSIGLPIPGFEMELTESEKNKSKKRTKIKEPILSVDTQEEMKINTGNEIIRDEPRVDKILSRTRPSIAKIKKMYISLILQEGAAPELIENIRQLTMAASKFDRNRGDKLTIMTASFKEKRDQRSAEQIMLKNIAEKIELLEEKREYEESEQETSWKDDLTLYREEEARRREDDKKFFESQIKQLEQQAKENAYEQEKKDMLMRDSLKLKKLNDEIQTLKQMLTSAEKRDSLEAISKQEKIDSIRYASLSNDLDKLSNSLKTALINDPSDKKEDSKAKIEEELKIREDEKKKRDEEISAKIKELDTVQSELDKLQQDMESGRDNKFIVFIGIGFILISLLIILIVMMLKNNKQPPTSPWMYPQPQRRPRPRKKLIKKKKEEDPEVKVKKEEPIKEVVDNQVKEDLKQKEETAPPVISDDDPDVVRSEISDIRKSVVSMSVGQPERTTTIVKEWLDQPAPPEPEPEPEPSSDKAQDGKEEK